MKLAKYVLLIATHAVAIGVGFAAGIYALPILIAPPAPSDASVASMSSQASYSAEFTRDLAGSDALHWGEGTVSLGPDYITFMGELAPGPDYKLYLSPTFVETEAEFEQLRSSMLRVGEVKTFKNFIAELDPAVDLAAFNTVVVWCETFGEFITAASYR